uniref:Uncharacterized protein n=1 Tax=Ovis aries TaxID=9940 RepID=A0AC11EE86_SHEEP
LPQCPTLPLARFPAPEGPRKGTIWAENISKKESVLQGPADNRIPACTALPSQAKHGDGRDSLKAGHSEGQTQGGEVCSSLRLCPLGSSPKASLLQLCKLFPSTGSCRPRADLRALGRASATHRVTEALQQGTSGLLLCQGEEYIMRNAGLEEAQAGIKIAGRNIKNLRNADDTTLMVESEEELKSLLMKVKRESEKVGLKLNIQKTKIMASGPITSWEIDEETVSDFNFLGSKVTADGDCSHEGK